MGWWPSGVSHGREQSDKGWPAEYDRRLRDPGVAKNYDLNGWGIFKANEARVQGDDGRFHMRDGRGCDGSGHHLDTEHPNYRKPPMWKRWRS